jgi:uncharacterized protein (DUF362 family)
MDDLKRQPNSSGPRINRRRFLYLAAGGVVLLATDTNIASAASYIVGVGKSSDPYEATLRAVNASGEWPSPIISGKTVVIKPNLVVPMTADTGVTTHPEVVRGLVDIALADGASQVLIVENGYTGANFSACGYDYFNSYDPRVQLVDLLNEPVVPVNVPNGLTYQTIYMPEVLLSEDIVFISSAKLKTHSHTHATLSVKNLIGLAPVENYRNLPGGLRFAMHFRGIHQAIVDVNLIRPIDFAVIDGVVGMEGDGPGRGSPVPMDMVVAGKNAVAVDRVCLHAASLPQNGVMHLTYAARYGLGPAGMQEITILGDPFTPFQFLWPPNLPPLIEYPRFFPNKFSPKLMQRTLFFFNIFPYEHFRRVDIMRTSDTSPQEEHIRTIRGWEHKSSGYEFLTWDGRDNTNAIVPPGMYCARVQAKYRMDAPVTSYASGHVLIL